MKAETSRNVCLVVIDGWGLSSTGQGNTLDAIKDAKTPIMDNLINDHPFIPLEAHGLSVGLPDGLMGNSEVGHLNLGAGRIVYQDIVRIEQSLKDGNLQANGELNDFLRKSQTFHLIGLVSDGGVHSHIEHLKGILKILKAKNIKDVHVHAITDGRDVSPKSAQSQLQVLVDFMKEINLGCLSSVVGRYYAMDRDKRWERTQVAFRALTEGSVDSFSVFQSGIQSRYACGETDEFFTPFTLPSFKVIEKQDGILFFNYRSDRMRQVVSLFIADYAVLLIHNIS